MNHEQQSPAGIAPLRIVDPPEKKKRISALDALRVFRAKMELRKQDAMQRYAPVFRKTGAV